MVYLLNSKNISLSDVRCGRFTHKHVWIQPDDQFIFSTQRKGEPFYKDKTRCSVRTLIVDLKFITLLHRFVTLRMATALRSGSHATRCR